jgi:hypothetical protein
MMGMANVHGLLAGQLDGAHEPELILTPPNTASVEEDSYLSASTWWVGASRPKGFLR